MFSSAWISKENVFNYLQFKSQFANKNRTTNFRRAIKEIEVELSHKTKNEITLKNMAINSILSTFDENIPLLKSIYKIRANIPNRFNKDNELDYLTILYRTVTPEQQHQMYMKIVQQFTGDERKYIENPTVSLQTNINNLF